MIRLPAGTLVLSVALTAVGAFSVWKRGNSELELRQRRENQPVANTTGHVQPSVRREVSFQEFYARYEEAGYGYRIGLIDALTVQELVALLNSASREPWDPRISPGASFLVERWMELDPDAALAWWLAQPPGQLRRATGPVVLYPWAESNPVAAVRWFRDRTGHRPTDFVEIKDKALQDEWGDIAAVLKECDTRPLDAIIKDLQPLSKKDHVPQSYWTPAARLTHEFDNSVRRHKNWRPALELLQTIAADSSNSLADWAENRKPFLLRKCVSDDPFLVMQWLEAHPHSAWGDGLVEEALGGLWSQISTNGDFRQSDAESPVARPSKEEVIEWFLRIPRVSNERSALEHFVMTWPDMDDAGTLLNEQPPVPDTDKARSLMALRVVDVDPPSSFQWAEAITDEFLRRKTESDLHTKWRRLDPAGADSWAASRAQEEAAAIDE